ncbi:hypothetical protein Poli38472_014591 [Pythium oligandrum]|uniref:Uncharacterized protein n=1 Tax=Pythium oligandrum TaxID=41045 RepID=A0A8K1FK05_PYTOL|nr:hypothetical protein Poli38472_014591 [Pythium oligandrum]|eukprot:TMW66615.1 hypothetical protein Poli38472_014591 [Pythium oligandrum]
MDNEWRGRAVAARTPFEWVHGQVLSASVAGIKVRYGDDAQTVSQPKDVHESEPIVALLLWENELRRSTTVNKLRTMQSTILDRLLGTESIRPTRDIAKILEGVVPKEAIPAGTAARSWVDPVTDSVHKFQLQHAVDFVYVNESNATHISRSLTARVGNAFFRPPNGKGPLRGAQPASPRATASGSSQTDSMSGDWSVGARSPSPPRPKQKRPAKRRPGLSGRDEVNDGDVESSDDEETKQADVRIRIIESLVDKPDLLEAFLRNQALVDSRRKRTKRSEDEDHRPKKLPKHAFNPLPSQQRVHDMVYVPHLEGTYPSDFLYELIVHSAVQFAPHPAVLIRLYDIQFGARGLSVMHLAWLTYMAKMEWEMSASVNMQNFAVSVQLPSPKAPESTEEVNMALSSLRAFATAFWKSDAVELVQQLCILTQSLVGMPTWETEDLPYLVHWINGRLEKYRSCAVADARSGGNTRGEVVKSVATTDMEFQMMQQLITTRRLQILQAQARASVANRTGQRTQVDWTPRPESPAASRTGRRANHKSAVKHASKVRERIEEGVRAGTYLVVDEDVFARWNVFVSPFGAIPKGGGDGVDAIRLIHDLSYPSGSSVNDATIRESLPVISYEYVDRLARRIEELHVRYPGGQIVMLKGDVNAAFRHLRQRAEDVWWMGARCPSSGAGVVDLSAPFGWTGSPALYAAFGRAISYIVGRESPASMSPGDADTVPFFAYEWVDDHILIEPDVDNRCAIAEDTLRLAMMAVLGPDAVNESKFTKWGSHVEALGLEWDCATRRVSMPAAKIDKALRRLAEAQRSTKISTVQLQQLLGSLRHVATCVKAARPFYQRLQQVCNTAPRFGSVRLGDWARDDLTWFEHILRHGGVQAIPTALFGTLPPPDVHVYADASDMGLCIINPAWNEYVLLEFDPEEGRMFAASGGQFDINIREQFALTLACHLFGPAWRAAYTPMWPHVRCWTDNRTACARTNRLQAQHQLAQELNRAIGLAQAVYRFHISSSHLPGAWNWLADAGSRLASGEAQSAVASTTHGRLASGEAQATGSLVCRLASGEAQSTCLQVSSERRVSGTWRFFRDNPVKNHSPNALFDSWNEFRRLVLLDGDAVLQSLYHRRDNFRYTTLGEIMEIHECAMRDTGICGIEHKYRCPMCYLDTARIELKLLNGRYAGFAYNTSESLTSRIVSFKIEKECKRSDQVLRRLSEALIEAVDQQLMSQALSHIESWIKRNTVSSEPAPTSALRLIEQQLTRVRRNSEQYVSSQFQSLNESILAIKNQQVQDRKRIESCSNAIVALAEQKKETSPNQHLLDTCTNMLNKHAREIERLKSTVQRNMEMQESLSSHSTMILSNASLISQLMGSVERIERRLPEDETLAFLDELDTQLNNSP